MQEALAAREATSRALEQLSDELRAERESALQFARGLDVAQAHTTRLEGEVCWRRHRRHAGEECGLFGQRGETDSLIYQLGAFFLRLGPSLVFVSS